MTPSATNNPIADELIRKHAELSPPAQQAIGMSKVPAMAETGLSPQLPPAPEVQPAQAEMPSAAATALPAPSRVRGLGPLPGSPAGAHQDELNRLEGSQPGYMGINIPGRAGHVLNPVLKGLSGIGDVIASGVFPNFGAFIPGTSAHHAMLVNQARNAVRGDQEAQAAEDTQRLHEAQAESEEAMPAYRQAETETAQQRAKTSQQEADFREKSFPGEEAERTARTRQLNAQAGALESPAAKGNIHVLPDGKVISVQTDPNTGKATAEVVFEGDPRRKTSAQKLEVGGEEHTVLVDENSGEVVKDLGKTGSKPPTVNVNAGTWALQEDPEGKPILFNSKTGETRESPGGIQRTGTHAKEEARVAGPRTAMRYASDYMGSGKFTGPGDEALLEKFFELAKPEHGFRMSQQQIELLQNSRSWMGSLQGKAYHALHGTWFTPQQRKEISDTMGSLARAGGLTPQAPVSSTGGGTQNQAPAPGTVQGGYRFKGGDPSKQENWERAQ